MVRAAFFLALALFVPSSTPASGPLILSADTVWKGTVDLSVEVVVESGATLLLLPGTKVRFVKPAEGEAQVPRVVVRGTLVAQGTPVEPILFTSSAEKPQPGDWGGIVFDMGSGRLRQCVVEYAQAALQAKLSVLVAEECKLRRSETGLGAGTKVEGAIFDCDVEENAVGLYFNQSSGFSVRNCRVKNSTRAGIACVNGSSPRIVNCVVTGGQGDGIACIQGSSPLLDGNLIAGNERGIFAELKSEPLVVRNEIRENQCGIWLQKLVSPRVLGNVVTKNKIGIYCNFSGYPKIQGNNLFGNESFGLVLGDQQSAQVSARIPYRNLGQFFTEAPANPETLPPQTRKFDPIQGSDDGLVDARGNWWGKEATEEMKALGEGGNVSAIEDGVDKPETDYLGERVPRDRVAFSPWEEQPLAAAGRPDQRYSAIRGKVILDGKPVSGARVHAYTSADGAFRGEGFAYAPTGTDGSFSLALRPGRYYLVAKRPEPPFPKREPEEGQLYGYYGGNPVALAEGQSLESNLQVVRRTAVAVGEARGEAAILEGVIVGPKGPEERAALFAYPDAKSDFRGPDLTGPQGSLAEGTGPDGRFSLELPPGTYYLTASRRKEGPTLGPLRAGDLYGYFDGNPVTLEAGKKTSLTLQMTEKLRDIEASSPAAVGLASIRGVIRDPAGKPLSGLFAFASTDPILAGGMPPFRSSRTGPDGAYRIDLPQAGTYYVGARSGYGGPPVPGQWQGFFGGDLPAPLAVQEGKATEGVDITVRRME